MSRRRYLILILIAVPVLLAVFYRTSPTFEIHEFEHTQIQSDFYCEGANIGDFSGDGVMDIVSGPFWHEGPDFETTHTYYEPKAYSIEEYSDCFFHFTYDFDADGLDDILRIGFPGQEAVWYRNPGSGDDYWEAYQVADEVSDESPTFADITGDGQPDLVAVNNGRFAYAEIADDPREKWTFYPISEDRELQRFTHGLGIGDVDGDGRTDLLEATGWYQQPASLEGHPEWTYHPYDFAQGSSHMFAYDVDGDGDNDVISAEYAHGWGLEWHEHVEKEGEITFVTHQIMGETPEENPYGVYFSQLHALELIDMNGDGLKDIVTGKRYWAHMGRDPGEMMPTVLYWFELKQDDGNVDFIPHLIGDQTGHGTQLVVKDFNDDSLPDIIIGNKKGTAYYVHRKKEVDQATWEAWQPERLSDTE